MQVWEVRTEKMLIPSPERVSPILPMIPGLQPTPGPSILSLARFLLKVTLLMIPSHFSPAGRILVPSPSGERRFLTLMSIFFPLRGSTVRG